MKMMLFIFILCTQVFAGGFEDAALLYQKKEYEKAIDIYEQLIKSGKENSAVYYNLGNSYYRTGKIGPAVFYFLKAEKLNPGDEDIQANIRIASRRNTDRIEKLPEGFVQRSISSFTGIFSSNGWAYSSFICFVFTLLSLLIFLFQRSLAVRRVAFFLVPVFMVLTAVSVSSAFYTHQKKMSAKKGVVVASSASVRSAPDTGSTETGIIHEGLILKVEDALEDWVKIRLTDGKTGWVQKSAVGVI